jgi:acetyl esterase
VVLTSGFTRNTEERDGRRGADPGPGPAVCHAMDRKGWAMNAGFELAVRGGVRWSAATIPGRGGPLRARVYRPAAAAGGRLVWAHGGSWRGGSLDGWHESCARLSAASGWSVISVEYRLAPRHPHPAPVLDILAALDWAARRTGPGGELPLAVGGDSAGGTIAACAALACRDSGRRLAAQVLAYPPFDPACAAPSYGFGTFPNPYALRAAWRDHRAGGAVVEVDGIALYSSPLEAPSLERLPPALLAVGLLDPVADDVCAYVDRLHEAGCEAELYTFPGVHHGAFLSAEALTGSLGAALSRRSK